VLLAGRPSGGSRVSQPGGVTRVVAAAPVLAVTSAAAMASNLLVADTDNSRNRMVTGS
jgi:hypothetical protein